jgi:hypothetical protein
MVAVVIETWNENGNLPQRHNGSEGDPPGRPYELQSLIRLRRMNVVPWWFDTFRFWASIFFAPLRLCARSKNFMPHTKTLKTQSLFLCGFAALSET